MIARPRARDLLALAIAFLLTFAFGLSRLVQVYRVQESSMTPGVNHGDRVLVTPLRGLPARGDIVLFGGMGPTVYVKRVVGLPGDRVELRSGSLRLNDRPAEFGPRGSASYPDLRCRSRKVLSVRERSAEASWTAYLDPGGGDPPDYGPVVVPPGTLFVLGDNRMHSLDSRRHGPVALDELVGVAWKVLRSDRCRD